MKQTPLSKDIIKTVTKVTGKKPIMVFNDKRVNFRRYKFTGVFDITPNQIRTINNTITKKYPQHQFVVNNEPSPKRKKSKNPCCYSYYLGMTIMVF